MRKQQKSNKRVIALSVWLCPLVLFGSDLTHSLSMQGYTGIINTPNAQVMNEGDITLSFNNQFDNHQRNYDYEQDYRYQEDYIFGSGLLPFFELQGRLSEARGFHRDLSGNVKVQLPFPLLHPYLPNVALGYQDIGSSVNFYGNKYVVMDKELWFVRLSLGYGVSDIEGNGAKISQRMDGIFGGAEVRTFDWFYLLGEYDGRERHAGVRIETPRSWSDRVKFNSIVAANLSDDNSISLAFNLVFSLYEHERYTPDSVEREGSAAVLVTEESVPTAAPDLPAVEELTASIERKQTEPPRPLGDLAPRLSDAGLENVTVATKGDTLYIAYENSVYEWNELDALGIVIGTASHYAGRYSRFVVEPLKSRVRVTAFHGSLVAAAAFFKTPSYTTKTVFTDSLFESHPIDKAGYVVVTDTENGTLFKPRLALSPKLSTFVGTEAGVFDYQLLLRLTGTTTLFKGLDFGIQYDEPVANSEELDPGGMFWRYYDNGGIYKTELSYSFNLFGVLNSLSAGQYVYDYAGAMDQLMYTVGRHTLQLKGGYFLNMTDGFEDDKKTLFIAGYSYHYVPWDFFLKVQGGRYWYQDIGFDVTLKRFFGDTAVSLGYLQSRPQSVPLHQAEEVNHYVALAVEIPLALRKSPVDSRYLQLKGVNSWQYGLRTTVARSDGKNWIVPGSGSVLGSIFEGEPYFRNRNRLSAEYLKYHLERMLNAYEKYAGQE
ncbi:YjbH domain-containing protein [Sulfurimonas diazotrophicus]|uniref:YjbH domain-containing protein n=1 Tax=Sulfurimonas diazotrophicus TaxID=3131939 RepID=A0ABZ3HAK1_9BACT